MGGFTQTLCQHWLLSCLLANVSDSFEMSCLDKTSRSFHVTCKSGVDSGALSGPGQRGIGLSMNRLVALVTSHGKYIASCMVCLLFDLALFVLISSPPTTLPNRTISRYTHSLIFPISTLAWIFCGHSLCLLLIIFVLAWSRWFSVYPFFSSAATSKSATGWKTAPPSVRNSGWRWLSISSPVFCCTSGRPQGTRL